MISKIVTVMNISARDPEGAEGQDRTRFQC
jgi:hypothetical protein